MCGGQHIKKDCFFRDKICFSCGHIDPRSSHCWSKQKKETKRKSQTNVNIVLSKNKIEEGQRRKYLNGRINGQTMKLLLDSGSDILVIKSKHGKKRLPTVDTDKIAMGVSGKRFKLRGELKCNISFMEKIHKLKVYVLPGLVNLFGTDWIVLFNLWELLINSYCNKVDVIENYKPKQTERFEKRIPSCLFRRIRAVHKSRSQV